MGGGRAKRAPVAGLIAVGLIAAAALAGCGETRHPNQQRPGVSTRVSVTITPGEVLVQPRKIATAAEKTQQIPQNQNDEQPPLKRDGDTPVDVTFVVSNQTNRDAYLIVSGAGQEVESNKIFARSPATFGAALPTGSYEVTADGPSPSPTAGQISVGEFRASSQNDLLLP
jgi:hypothetical protein